MGHFWKRGLVVLNMECTLIRLLLNESKLKANVKAYNQSSTEGVGKYGSAVVAKYRRYDRERRGRGRGNVHDLQTGGKLRNGALPEQELESTQDRVRTNEI